MTKTRHKALLITFEGIDGCGKSTQVMRTSLFLKKKGCRFIRLREPGSTRVAERIRKILLDTHLEMTDITELLLYEAARADIVTQEIRPALKTGNVVLCDRFYDSTTAYQGFGRGLDIRMVESLHRVAVGDLHPDLTFVFDLDLKTAFARRELKPDRLEKQSAAFHRRVRKGFLDIARRNSRRVKVIDASHSIDRVFEDVREHLSRKLGIQ